MSEKTKFQKGLRQKFVKVKTAKGRKSSSTRWLQRQLNDPYTILAKRNMYRSRAAYKLLEIEQKFKFIKKAKIILDLGCAPGGWMQVCREINEKARIIGVDIQNMDSIDNTGFIKGDFLEDEVQADIFRMLNGGRDNNLGGLKENQESQALPTKIDGLVEGRKLDKSGDVNRVPENKKIDLIMSDIAPPTCGHNNTDHLRIMHIIENIIMFNDKHLKHNGNFISKVFLGSETQLLVQHLKSVFKEVKLFKPNSSRKESKEQFLVCLNNKK